MSEVTEGESELIGGILFYGGAAGIVATVASPHRKGGDPERFHLETRKILSRDDLKDALALMDTEDAARQYKPPPTWRDYRWGDIIHSTQDDVIWFIKAHKRTLWWREKNEEHSKEVSLPSMVWRWQWRPKAIHIAGCKGAYDYPVSHSCVWPLNMPNLTKWEIHACGLQLGHVSRHGCEQIEDSVFQSSFTTEPPDVVGFLEHKPKDEYDTEGHEITLNDWYYATYRQNR